MMFANRAMQGGRGKWAMDGVARQRALVEELESRMLLSHSPIGGVRTTSGPIGHATTNYVIASSSATASANDGLSPAQLCAAYGINQISFNGVKGDGTGQTIAIVDAYDDPNIAADLHTFDVTYGLSDPTLIKLNQNGGTKLPSTDPAGAGDSWAMEISLDVEWAHAVAPGATILLVEANTDSDPNLMKAVNTARSYAGVSVVSMSWGSSESASDLPSDKSFTTPSGHQNVVFVASAGDNGAYGDGYTQTKSVDYPASSPNVMAVGGTTLTVDANGNYVSESAWGDGSRSSVDGGGGGGISTIETQPAYQNGVVTQSTTHRGVPDVSINGDPLSGVAVVDSWDAPRSPWTVIGGTSLGAPVWSAIVAIADQGRVAAGKATLTTTEALALVYAASSSDFHDITTGNTGYAATAGYDLATGRGTPIANLLVSYIVGSSSTTTTTPTAPVTTTPASVPSIAAFSSSATTVEAGTTLTLVASGVTDTLGSITAVSFYLETNQTTGLQAGSDRLVGTGTSNGHGTWSVSSTTAGFTPGTYTYYAVASDSMGATSVAKTLTVTIVGPAIGALSITPGSVTVGATVTLTATNVAEPTGSIAGVAFYLAGTDGGADRYLGAGVQSGTTWTFTAGTAGLVPGKYTYYAVATDSGGNASAGAMAILTVASGSTLVASVNNDNFANATVLSGTSLTVTGSNVGASKEKGEPTIAGRPGGKSVWYAWTATSDGVVTLDTAGSDFDTLLGVYTGKVVSKLGKVASNDDAGPGELTSGLSFKAAAGTTYYFAVDGYRGAAGNVTLNLEETPAPVNDNFTAAAVLTGDTARWTGTNIGASRQAGEPRVSGNTGGSSVWLAWTAPTSGTMTVSTAGSDFDAIVGIYTGAAVSHLRAAARNSSATRQLATEALTFNAVAGTTYYFAIDGFRGEMGNIVFTLEAV